MRFEIKSWLNGGILFSIETESWKLAVEAAVKSLVEALESIKSQCSGHADEFSGNVWRICEGALDSIRSQSEGKEQGK